nr:hypothetical protein [Dechloromonas sp.]
MSARILALVTAAALAAGCATKETKTEPAAAPTASTQAATPAAAPSKPVCPAEPATKKKTSKSKKTETPPADCEPAKPAAKAAEPAAAPASTAVITGSTAGKACNPCVVKSRDGTFDGEVYGTIPPGSKWAQLRIGMEQPEVERLLGVSHQVHAYPTGKAYIPFYYGTDRYRYEVSYPGYGSVSYTGGSWGAGRGVMMMINYTGK